MENNEGTSATSAGETSDATVARKPCPACGEMIVDTAKKCRFCGEVLDASPVPVANAGAVAATPPDEFANKAGAAKPLLYNPDIVFWLSWLFTPVFGGWCCRHNYLALGLPDKARRSQSWMIICFIISVLLPIELDVRICWVITYVVWYCCDGREHSQFIKGNNIAYEKKSWGKTILGAIGLQIAVLALILIIGGLWHVIGGGGSKNQALEKDAISLVDQIVTKNVGGNAPKCTKVEITGQKDDRTYTGTAFFANGKSLGIIIDYNSKTNQIEVTIPNQ